jgi:hypothetical protein
VNELDPAPVSPVRDDHELGPTESLDREPDGVPHDIVGRTAFAACLLAAGALAMFFVVGWLATAVFGALAVSVMVIALQRKSTRERDHDHPSR